ncbi:MBL fold metallo-hydrolase [Leucobacter chinensis]|uniref:MBL fold metallo-hydrolase n=1 Tax=Leucobacter chinensis TaxID=2851010 RepID=UPI001C232B6F|nr:MBL fold metallo-hydrolase [Leucobacter chinensis]
MLLERIYDEDLAQASYLIGCQAQGEAIVVDARRDTGVYERIASANGMTIVAVTETHIHADYLSGTRELAAKTGARVYVSDEGGPEWTYGERFDGAVRMKHGHRIELGNISLEAVHTPGHTPEHLSFLVTDGAQSPEPGFMLTGDFVFVGDLGRPDLLDEAAGFTDTRFAGAAQLFESLKRHFVTLPDYVQVLPGHGSGSACGKALGSIAATTVGYERNFSWWAEYLREDDEQGFVAALLDGQPDAHAYFERMKRQNKLGPEVMGERPPLREYEARELAQLIKRDEVVVIDTRHHAAVHEGTLAGALAVPGSAKAASYGAWVVNPEAERRPLVVLAESREAAEQFGDHLVRVGIDTLAGFVTSFEGLPLVQPAVVKPGEARGFLLDVRNKTEFAAGHLPGAQQLSSGRLLWHLDELPAPEAGPVVMYCRSGVRSAVAASGLRLAGYDVAEVEGGYMAWAALPGSQPQRDPAK